MTYICQKYDRQDLLGKDIRARVIKMIFRLPSNKSWKFTLTNSLTQWYNSSKWAILPIRAVVSSLSTILSKEPLKMWWHLQNTSKSCARCWIHNWSIALFWDISLWLTFSFSKPVSICWGCLTAEKECVTRS